MITRSVLSAAVTALLAIPILSFSPDGAALVNTHATKNTHFMFFANEVQEEPARYYDVSTLDGSEASIRQVASFMIDAFWLQSPQALGVKSGDEISSDAKSSLVEFQANDLLNKYGERLGKRKLDAVILTAVDDATENFLGLVTIEVRLLDTISKTIMNTEKSELMLTNAISSLGPKQRREYKDASVIDAANALLPPEFTAVCSLSNLCVSPKARRKGVAARLCEEAESLSKKLGFDDIHLCVESENKAAKSLYEKLGYGIKFETTSKSLRVDADAGVFVDIESEIIVMTKKI